ncbi:MAG: S8 family serine peptidase [Gammaproteobacteria bacterium]|nr:S8 family serine peptidase [Gammaproteobacteria bacterium]
MKITKLIAGFILLAVTCVAHAVMPADGNVTQQALAMGVIVKMRDNATPPAIAKAGGQPRLNASTLAVMKVVAATDLKFKRTATQGTQVLNFSQAMSLADAQAVAERLMTLPDVEYATPNIIYHPLDTTPDDPRFVDGTQWSLDGALAGANLPAAWDTTTGSAAVPIAIIDTGYTEHSELNYAAFAAEGYDFISDPTMAGDGNGRDHDARDEGDFCTTPLIPPPTASSWHGTAVMSIIGALTNNATLMAGINWHAHMIPVRILGRCGGTNDDLIDAIRWAAGLHVAGVPDNPNPAKVINMSLGGAGTCDALTQAAIDDAHAAGAVIIAAAGNENLPATGTVPANCNHVMPIAAHTIGGDRAVFSNYGDIIALSAPGTAIYIATCSSSTVYTCKDSTAVTSNSGTSLSAPMVSGVASLLFAENNTLSNFYVESILRTSARPFVAGSSCIGVCGSGMLDAAAAVSLAKTLTPTVNQIEISKSGGGSIMPVFWITLGLLAFVWRSINVCVARATVKRRAS